MRDYNFGNLIFELRKERNLTQTQLGEQVGVSNKTVSKWENGITKPNVTTLYKLADFFKVSVDELASGKINSKPENSFEMPENTEASSVKHKRLRSAATVSILCLVVAVVVVLFIQLTQMTTVPDITGQTLSEAQEIFSKARLNIKIRQVYSDTLAPDTVISQSIAKGKRVKKGSRVDVVISTDADLVSVPDVTGLAEDKAVDTLRKAGFSVETDILCSDSVAEGLIISQSKEDTAVRGSNILLYVSVGVSNTQGNTNSNAVNYGYVAAQGDWIYYCNYRYNNALYKMRPDGSEKQILTTDSVSRINVIGEWIYYYGGPSYGKGIYKIKLDGSDKTKISDQACNWMMVIGDDIYYTVSSQYSAIRKMKTDGSSDTVIIEGYCKDANIIGEWIYYRNSNNVYKVSTDGEEYEAVNRSHSITSLSGEDDYLYAARGSDFLRIKTTGDQSSLFSGTKRVYLQNYNYCNGTLYFLQQDSSYGYTKFSLHKRTRDNTEDRQVMQLASGSVSSFYINVIDDWIYFPNPGNNRYMYRVKTDGTCIEKVYE